MAALTKIQSSHSHDLQRLSSDQKADQKLERLTKQVTNLSTTLSTRLEHAVNTMKRDQKGMQERVVSQSTAKLTQELRTQVERAVVAEMKRSVIPGEYLELSTLLKFHQYHRQRLWVRTQKSIIKNEMY